MSTTLRERPVELQARDGGGPARRAVVRWAWRLFRREWRQQLLVLALLIVAVAATTAGAAVATATTHPPETTFTLSGSDPQLAADIAAIHKTFGNVAVIAHQTIAIPGSVATLELRAQDPNRTSGRPALRLLAGRYPTGLNEVAMTHEVAAIFNLRIGDTWHEGGRDLRVVGLVENPLHLREQFALVAPGQISSPATVTILIDTAQRFDSFRLPSGSPLAIESQSSAAKNAAAAAVLALDTIGLLFVGLVAVAGFTVMAQRRLRALGLLGSLGATDRHVRMVMLANGAAVGAAAAVVGTGVGLAGWLAFAPQLETIAGHRIDRFDLPWWAIGASMVLAILTALAAAWWPARTASRIPVVSALSGRPPRPQPGHRFAALGGLLLATGLILLAVAHQKHPPLIITGAVATTIGVLLLAPLAIRALAGASRHAPIAVRLALRDLARYQARSGAALGAVALAVGIAATIAVSAAARAAASGTDRANLPANQLIVYISANGRDSLLGDLAPAQLEASRTHVDGIATSLGTHDVLALDAAADPTGPDLPGLGNGQGGKEPAALVRVIPQPRGFEVRLVTTLYVATPALLSHYGIKPGQVDPTANILTSRTDLAGLDIGYGPRHTSHTKIQTINLPTYTSGPNTLITTQEVKTLGLQLFPAAWLIQTPRPLTTAQANTARQIAAAAGLTIETRSTRQSLTTLGHEATAAGILLALGVLGMTVGLIRSETAHDLRILAAAGATSTTRRTLTGATAGALALLGALLGTAGAYVALMAWHRSDLHTLTHIPVANLLVIIIGLPLAATTAGWLLAGREPPAIARRPLE